MAGDASKGRCEIAIKRGWVHVATKTKGEGESGSNIWDDKESGGP